MASGESPSRPAPPHEPVPPARMALSTDVLPERDRLPFVRDALARIILTDIEPLAEGPPRFRMEAVQAGPTGFAFIEASSSRLWHHGDKQGDFTLVVYSDGWLQAEHNNRQEIVRPGDAFLFNNAIPGLGDIPHGARAFTLRIDSDALHALVRHPEDKAGMRFPADQPGMALLKGYLQAFLTTRDVLTPALLHSFGLHVIDLVAAIIGPSRDGAAQAEEGLKAARLREILSAIAARAAEPDFGIDAVGAQLAVTPRYIQRLLEETGSTFSEHLLEHRLRRAWRALSDPACDLKVATIAFDCGFNDLGTFNRVFRRRFGETPTAVRGAATAAPAGRLARRPTLAERLARTGDAALA
jgi:AraC-like DNA-binding protein